MISQEIVVRVRLRWIANWRMKCLWVQADLLAEEWTIPVFEAGCYSALLCRKQLRSDVACSACISDVVYLPIFFVWLIMRSFRSTRAGNVHEEDRERQSSFGKRLTSVMPPFVRAAEINDQLHHRRTCTEIWFPSRGTFIRRAPLPRQLR